MEEYMKIPYAFSEINGGIIAFRKCERWKFLLELWNKYYQKYIKITIWDQPSFRIALWESQIKLYCLPVEYNRRGLHTKEKCINLSTSGETYLIGGSPRTCGGVVGAAVGNGVSQSCVPKVGARQDETLLVKKSRLPSRQNTII